MPYYTQLQVWTDNYAATIGMSGSYGHDYCNASAAELVHWDNVVTKTGCRGQTTGDIYRKWDVRDDMFDSDIAACMHHSR